jgi:thioredoxin 1
MRFVIIALLLSCIIGCQSNQIASLKPKNLVGEVSQQQLLSSYPAFAAEYQDYQPAEAEILAVTRLQGHAITVLFGTWCHDSEREVPRLLKLLDKAEMSAGSVRLIAVNPNKQEPTGLYRSLNLRYTPTIILFAGDKELGRIIERPINSLGEDLSNMVP